MTDKRLDTTPADSGRTGGGKIHPGETPQTWSLHGLVVLALLSASGWILGDVTGVSRLLLSLLLTAMWANFSPWAGATMPTLSWAAKLPLRLGIVLLGLRLSYDAIAGVGGPGLVIVVVTVLTALLGGTLIGSRLRLSGPLTLLVSVGFAICGQSAIAATAPLSGAEDDEVGYAVAMVALFGGLAIFALPALNQLLGFSDATFGVLAGASVHDTSQVIATASVVGDQALETATIVKLTRVLFLGPVLLGVALMNGRSNRKGVGLQQFLPWYVIGFVVAIAARSLDVVPTEWLGALSFMEGLAFTVAMVGVGSSIRFSRLRALGRKPLTTGMVLWCLIVAVSALAIQVTGV